MEDNNLLDNVYLPSIQKSEFEGSKSYDLVKKNDGDLNELATGEKSKELAPPDEFNFSTFDEVENFKAQHMTKENMKMFAEGLVEFGADTLKDAARTAALVGINGADFAVNFLPAIDKVLDYAPNNLTVGKDGLKFNDLANDDQIMEYATSLSSKLGEAREWVKDFKPTDNIVTELAGVIGQDMAYSVPIYKKLKTLGVPNGWNTLISYGIGGAIGIEDEIFGNTSTFLQHYRESDIKKIKDLIGIIPDTPYDQIADEVVQMFEYGGLSWAIPQLIKAFQMGKKHIPVMAGTTGAYAATMVEGNSNVAVANEKKTLKIQTDEEGKPLVNEMNVLKPLIDVGKNVFSSVVKSSVKNLPNKGGGEQILNTLKNMDGVKSSEIKWIGLDDYLKNKKTVTKPEIEEFVKNNAIDVNEVKFGGDVKVAKLSDDIEFQKNEFEQKFLDDVYKKDNDMIGEVPEELLEEINYDVYAIKLGEITDKSGTMDFNTLASVIGQDFTEATFEKASNNLLRWTGNTAVPTARKGGDLFISPLELEKYKVENAVRQFRNSGDVKAPKFQDYTEPGGKDYTELVFTIKKGGMDIGIPTVSTWDKTAPKGYTGPVGSITEKATAPFKSTSHMNVKSEIAHVRFKTRYADNLGKNKIRLNPEYKAYKILSVEEMQSDFAMSIMRSHKKGADKNLKIDFPFKNTWYELTVKRLIRYAADNGFDAIAIPKGSVAAKRYGQNIDKVTNLRVEVYKHPKGKIYLNQKTQGSEINEVRDNFEFDIGGYNKDDQVVFAQRLDNKDIYKLTKEYKIPNHLKEHIDDILEGRYEFGKNEIGENLHTSFTTEVPEKVVGSGKGKHQLYDQAIPSFMKKYSKKWNAKVYEDKLDLGLAYGSKGDGTMPVTILEITPEMKKSVTEQGQPLFEFLGLATAGAATSKAVSDNIKNNSISNTTN